MGVFRIDFKRYSVGLSGTGQRQGMAPPRFANRPPNESSRDEQARELHQFFQDNGAVFMYNYPMIRNGASRNEFRSWFEFIVKKLNRNYELSDQNNAINEEVVLRVQTALYHLVLGPITTCLSPLSVSCQEQYNDWSQCSTSMAYHTGGLGLAATPFERTFLGCFDFFECL